MHTEEGKIPLIALDDVGIYSLWAFDNPVQSAGLNLDVATEEVSFAEIVDTFTKITGKKAIHVCLSLEEYLPLAEPFPNAMANWAAGPDAVRDDGALTWRENFSAWWRYWGEGKGTARDMAFLDRIHPARIRSLEEWMRKVDYDGKPRPILKDIADLRELMQRSR